MERRRHGADRAPGHRFAHPRAFRPGIVTTTRSDAHIGVTEYGIAELRGQTVPERAEALIAIAQPDFRTALQKAADSGLV